MEKPWDGSKLSTEGAGISKCHGIQEERHGKGNGMKRCQEKLRHPLAFPWWPKGKFLLSGQLQALWAHRCQVLLTKSGCG